MFFSSKKSVTVKRVGHNLVAAFHSAHPPLVWQFDLERNHSFTIALQGEDGDWELGITSPKGEFFPIAHFPVREDAEEALAKTQKILMKKRRSIFWRILRFFLGLILLGFILMMAWSYYMYHHAMSLGLFMPGSASMVAAPAALPAADVPQGVPVPADEVLRAPR